MSEQRSLVERLNHAANVQQYGTRQDSATGELLREAAAALEWQGQITKSLLPYQERAVKAETALAQWEARWQAVTEYTKHRATVLHDEAAACSRTDPEKSDRLSRAALEYDVVQAEMRRIAGAPEPK